ncbi:MAG: hypothetical protein ACD_63C00011G0004 [uncultured bacterium]|nr:MAG: hypothetical protein ACD_63C00011G0004 [uncultured bacterium]
MNLKEYQGKELFHEYGIPIPTGVVVSSSKTLPKEIEKIKGEVVLKVQVGTGKRKKAGGVKIVENFGDNVKKSLTEMLGKDFGGEVAEKVLVYEKVEIEREMYLSITVDRGKKCPVVIFSKDGGIDIEELSEKYPDKIKKFFLKNLDFKNYKKEITKSCGEEVAEFAEKLYELFLEKDATLVEVNPLGKNNDGLVAIDSKVVIDDNALFRHEELLKYKTEDLTALEREAKENDLAYVELDGDIAVIGNGAGLVMATLDTVAHFGGHVANFLDVGGGATADKMKKALEIVLKKKGIKKVFINIFGGITRADEIAKGLVDYISENKLDIPVVLRMVGTRETEAKKILADAKIDFYDDMEDAVKDVVGEQAQACL